jgi:hypothetical protein
MNIRLHYLKTVPSSPFRLNSRNSATLFYRCFFNVFNLTEAEMVNDVILCSLFFIQHFLVSVICIPFIVIV